MRNILSQSGTSYQGHSPHAGQTTHTTQLIHRDHNEPCNHTHHHHSRISWRLHLQGHSRHELQPCHPLLTCILNYLIGTDFVCCLIHSQRGYCLTHLTIVSQILGSMSRRKIKFFTNTFPKGKKGYQKTFLSAVGFNLIGEFKIFGESLDIIVNTAVTESFTTHG